MAQITLTEEKLRNIISETISQYLNEAENEGLWNQGKTAAKTFFSGKHAGNGLGARFNAAKKNFQTQGKLDDIQGLIQQLSQMVDNRQIDPNITVAQLIGGKYNKGRFGKMTGVQRNYQSQIANRMEQ